MTQGAAKLVRADDQPHGTAEEAVWDEGAAWEGTPPRPWPAIISGILLALLAVGWVAALSWTLFVASPGRFLPPLTLAAWIGLASGPLALIAILYLLLLRTGRAEARAYSRASARLRADTNALIGTLGMLNQRIAEAR